MSEQRIHVFMPSEDGEYVPVKFVSADNDLKDDAVLIFLDEDEKSIFIWTGSDSPVRKRFISSQIARQMRLEKGLTHRVSTEDQGNETDKFLTFMERLKGVVLHPKTLLEVSPPPGAADLPPTKPLKPKKLKTKDKVTVKPDKEKAKIIEVVSPPIPETTTTPPPSPTSASVSSKELKKLALMKELYFSTKESNSIPQTKGKRIFLASEQNFILYYLFISTSSTEGEIEFFSIPKTTKTTTCIKEKPILVIYLNPNTNLPLELKSLYIQIPAGHSLYFTCPENTFIGLNLKP